MKLKLVGEGWWGWPLETRFVTEAKLECTFDLTGVPAGHYRVVIVEPDGSKRPFATPIQVLPAVQEVPKRGI